MARVWFRPVTLQYKIYFLLPQTFSSDFQARHNSLFPGQTRYFLNMQMKMEDVGEVVGYMVIRRASIEERKDKKHKEGKVFRN
jgi:hypothetical protein